MSTGDEHNLARFIQAQAGVYDTALSEIRSGRKRSHWMWFIFPQFAGLGSSPMSEKYAIKSLDEARAYLSHPVLGSRLRECCEAVLAVEGLSALEIFGSPDNLKLWSCATLFAEVSPPGSVFHRLLAKYFGDEILIRPAGEGDIDAALQLVADCIAGMREEGIDQWDHIYPSRQTVTDDIRDGTMHLAFDRGLLVGAMVLNETQNAEWADALWTIHGMPILIVHRLMVDPRQQGKRIGRRLMEFADAWGRERGYGVIRLDAFCANPRALRLYQGLGYLDAGEATFRKGRFRCFEKRIDP